MDKNRKKLTPAKIVIVYLIAFCLVSFHEADRIVSWVEQSCLEWDSAPAVLSACDKVRSFADAIGHTAMKDAERSALAYADELPEIGANEDSAGPPAAVPSNKVKVAVSETSTEPAAAESTEPAAAPEPVMTAQVEPTAESPPAPVEIKPDIEDPKPAKPAGSSMQKGANLVGDKLILANRLASAETPAMVHIADKDGKQAESPKPGTDTAKEQPAETEPAANAEKPENGDDASDKTEPAAKVEPVKTAPQKPVKLHPKKVLIAGDSMILEGFGVALQRKLKTIPGLEVSREGKYSSGLSRPDYFDWPAFMTTILDKHKPDLLVVSLGANDPQDILDENRKRHFVATESWNKIYKERAAALLKIPSERGITTIWVGLPIMGRQKYGKRIEVLNRLAQEACKENPLCHFVDTWLTLADKNDKYTTFIKNDKGKTIRIRAKDKIHLTEAGGMIMTGDFMTTVDPYVDFTQAAAKEKNEADGKANDKVDGSKAEVKKEEQPQAQLEKFTFTSPARQKDVSYYAFVPKNAGPDHKMPALYLLHGAWDSYEAWKDNAEKDLLRLAAEYGLVIITPDGDPFGWYADSKHDPKNQIETHIMDELIPKVEKELPVLPGKRGIAGLSMGGHGAMVLSLRHPGAFQSVSTMSGVLDITAHQTKKWELGRVFGPYAKFATTWQDHSAYLLLDRREDPAKLPPMLFSVSLSDPWVLGDNRAVHEKLKAMGVRHEYREKPGKHDWEFWLKELPEHVAFHAHVLCGKPWP